MSATAVTRSPRRLMSSTAPSIGEASISASASSMLAARPTTWWPAASSRCCRSRAITNSSSTIRSRLPSITRPPPAGGAAAGPPQRPSPAVTRRLPWIPTTLSAAARRKAAPRAGLWVTGRRCQAAAGAERAAGRRPARGSGAGVRGTWAGDEPDQEAEQRQDEDRKHPEHLAGERGPAAEHVRDRPEVGDQDQEGEQPARLDARHGGSSLAPADRATPRAARGLTSAAWSGRPSPSAPGRRRGDPAPFRPRCCSPRAPGRARARSAGGGWRAPAGSTRRRRRGRRRGSRRVGAWGCSPVPAFCQANRSSRAKFRGAGSRAIDGGGTLARRERLATRGDRPPSVDSNGSPMSDDRPRSTARIAGHPIHPKLVPFPIVCFVGALLTDIAYWRTADIMWANFSAWLLAAGLAWARWPRSPA